MQVTKFYPGDDPTKHVDLCQKEWKRLGYHDERTWPHFFVTTLDDLPNKWYKIEEARGDTFTWQTLRENFIKDFSFTPNDEKIKPIAKQIQQFIGAKSSNETVENNPTKECRHMSTDEIQHSTKLQLEIDYFLGKSFQLKKNHSLGNIKVKTLYKIETKEKPTEENIEDEKPRE